MWSFCLHNLTVGKLTFGPVMQTIIVCLNKQIIMSQKCLWRKWTQLSNVLNCLCIHCSEKNKKCAKPVCRYFGTPKGSFSGNNCSFLHPEEGLPTPALSHDGSLPESLQSSNHYTAADMNMAQDSCHVSTGTIFTISWTLIWSQLFIKQCVTPFFIQPKHFGNSLWGMEWGRNVPEY